MEGKDGEGGTFKMRVNVGDLRRLAGFLKSSRTTYYLLDNCEYFQRDTGTG